LLHQASLRPQRPPNLHLAEKSGQQSKICPHPEKRRTLNSLLSRSGILQAPSKIARRNYVEDEGEGIRREKREALLEQKRGQRRKRAG